MLDCLRIGSVITVSVIALGSTRRNDHILVASTWYFQDILFWVWVSVFVSFCLGVCVCEWLIVCACVCVFASVRLTPCFCGSMPLCLRVSVFVVCLYVYAAMCLCASV